MILSGFLLFACSSSSSYYDGDRDLAETPDGDEENDSASETDVEADADGDGDGDGDAEGEEEASCENLQATFGADGLTISVGCGAADLNLFPWVKIDGEWKKSENCEGGENRVSCVVGDAGTVSIEHLDDGAWRAGFEATKAVDIEAFSLEGVLNLPGTTSWLSNGFQSWSQSGMLAIAKEPAAEDLSEALSARGDMETIRTGEALSWWYTYAGGGDVSLVAGVRSAERFRSWCQIYKDEAGKRHLRLVNGGAGEHVALEMGESLSGETWTLRLGADLIGMLEDYGKNLPARRRNVLAPVDAGWNSWYDLWDTVSAQAVKDNAAKFKEKLLSRLPEGQAARIVIDDGWQVAWGEWTPNEKFPNGLDGLVADLNADGFETGVWLAPFLVEEDNALVVNHPEWFVKDAAYGHATDGWMKILDPTHPEAAEHMKGFISRIAGWGLDFIKIDFLFAGMFEGERHEDVTPVEAYNRGLAIIREAAGEDTIILTVGAPPFPSMIYADAWRLGGDIALEPFGPDWAFAVNQARSIAARWPFCYAMLCDADPVILRELSENEVDAGGWVVAMAGGALFWSDILTNLDEERFLWGMTEASVNQALAGFPMIPQDPIPKSPPESLGTPVQDMFLGSNTHVVPMQWTLSDGSVLLFNPDNDAASIAGEDVPGRSAVHLESAR